MSTLDSAVVLLRGKKYGGSGDWLDESGNGHDAAPTASPTFTTDHFTLNGTTQYLRVANHANLNFGTTDPFTIMCRLSMVDATPAATAQIINKYTAGFVGYALVGTTTVPQFAIFSAGNGIDNAPAQSDGVVFVLAGVRNIVDDDVEVFVDGTGSGTPATDGTTASLANSQDLGIGARLLGTPDQFAAADIYDVVLWSEALSDADVLAAGNELVGRSRMLLLKAG